MENFAYRRQKVPMMKHQLKQNRISISFQTIQRNSPKMTLSKAFVCLIIASSIGHLAQCKSLKSIPTSDKQEDPLLALPTEQASHHSEYIHLQQPADGSVSYVGSPDQQLPHNAAPAYEQPTSEVKEEVYYVMRPETEASVQQGESHVYVPVPEAESGAQAQDENTKYEYPGEIIYIGQNENPFRVLSEAQQPSAKESISGAAGMISDSMGMPATILTEIPAKDMPQHVLEKLKKDYGVKVVATREYPGANLVINCDEESSQSSGICAKTLAFTTISRNAPYTYQTPSDDNHKLTREQPNQQSYSTGDVQSGAISDTEGYVTRNVVITEQYVPDTQTEASTSNQQTSGESAKAEAQADNDSGFETEASGKSEKRESRQN